MRLLQPPQTFFTLGSSSSGGGTSTPSSAPDGIGLGLWSTEEAVSPQSTGGTLSATDSASFRASNTVWLQPFDFDPIEIDVLFRIGSGYSDPDGGYVQVFIMSYDPANPLRPKIEDKLYTSLANNGSSSQVVAWVGANYSSGGEWAGTFALTRASGKDILRAGNRYCFVIAGAAGNPGFVEVNSLVARAPNAAGASFCGFDDNVYRSVHDFDGSSWGWMKKKDSSSADTPYGAYDDQCSFPNATIRDAAGVTIGNGHHFLHGSGVVCGPRVVKQSFTAPDVRTISTARLRIWQKGGTPADDLYVNITGPSGLDQTITVPGSSVPAGQASSSNLVIPLSLTMPSAFDTVEGGTYTITLSSPGSSDTGLEHGTDGEWSGAAHYGFYGLWTDLTSTSGGATIGPCERVWLGGYVADQSEDSGSTWLGGLRGAESYYATIVSTYLPMYFDP